MRSRRSIGAALGAALFLTGCAAPAGQGLAAALPDPTASATVTGPTTGAQAPWTTCAGELGKSWPIGWTTESAMVPRLGGGRAVSSIVICGDQEQTRADGSVELVATEQRSSNVTALVAALLLPDERPPAHVSCTDDLQAVVWFALLDAHGAWVRPGVPLDGCREPRIEVLDALRALPLRTVSTTPVQLIESAAAVKSGCSQTWADEVWVDTHDHGRPTGARLTGSPYPGHHGVRLCVYDVPTSEQGSDKPAGMFAQGHGLAIAARAVITALLLAAPPATGSCDTEATRFALLWPRDGFDPTVYVELTGCHRIVVEPSSGAPTLAGVAGPALVAALERP